MRDPKHPAAKYRPSSSGRLLARNALWNLAGYVAPLIVALAATPALVRGLGNERFGVLTLAWTLVGYASLFDLGLGRALTQLVAMKLGSGAEDEVPALVWTSMFLMLGFGAVGTLVMVLATPWLVRSGLHVPAGLQSETRGAFMLLSFSLPIVITTAGLRGLLEAHQRFEVINGLRVPMGVWTFAGPLLVLPFSKSLVFVVGVLVLGRALAGMAHLACCWRIVPQLAARTRWQPSLARDLLRFGGWMTVSNLVSPLMVTLDRFLVGAMLSVTAITFYVTPFEVVSRLSIFPSALVAVMFPAYASNLQQDPERTAVLYQRSIKTVFLTLFPVVLILMVLAPEALTIWLGREFSERGSAVLRWLALGMFINGLASFPFALVQGAGRADLTAKLHLVELPAYLLGLYFLIRSFGITGAAMAWTLRATVDALSLFAMAGRFVPLSKTVWREASVLSAMVLAALVLAVRLHGLWTKGIFVALAGGAFLLAAWFLVLSDEERRLARGLQIAKA